MGSACVQGTGLLYSSQHGSQHASWVSAQVKFNVNRVDNMVIQAIALLDTLDKDINTFVMRVREWYSWHFPSSSRQASPHPLPALIAMPHIAQNLTLLLLLWAAWSSPVHTWTLSGS